MNAKIEVDAGTCGFQTTIQASSEDDQNVAFDIQSDCEKIRGLADDLKSAGQIDAYQEISPKEQSVILNAARARLKGCCAGCAVPVAIFKGMQASAGLALPKDISIRITLK